MTLAGVKACDDRQLPRVVSLRHLTFTYAGVFNFLMVDSVPSSED